jgi:hypothetical protein
VDREQLPNLPVGTFNARKEPESSATSTDNGAMLDFANFERSQARAAFGISFWA